MTHKINKKIVSYKVLANDDKAAAAEAKAIDEAKSVESMHENVERPEAP